MRYFQHFFIFWFLQAPRNVFAFFLSLNKAYLTLFSIQILLKTYFKPWKNEYREGLIGFSIAMGIFIKTIFLAISLGLFIF